jgi:peptidoglycan biosynthesis protein MviN/MurJ (putative lipid II flippase)
MRRRIDRLNGREIVSAFVRIAASAAVMSAVCYLSYKFLTAQFPDKHFLIRLVEAFVPIGLGGAAFFAMTKLLKIREVEQVLRMIRQRLSAG